MQTKQEPAKNLTALIREYIQANYTGASLEVAKVAEYCQAPEFDVFVALIDLKGSDEIEQIKQELGY